jgi:hypothetical protein
MDDAELRTCVSKLLLQYVEDGRRVGGVAGYSGDDGPEAFEPKSDLKDSVRRILARLFE